MNDASVETFKNDGGTELIGRSVIDCHPAAVQARVQEIYESQEPNAYTIEKHGKKKRIYQTPILSLGNQPASLN